MENPDYTLTTDTLVYNTDLHTAFITCPTEIVNEDNHITTSRGQFNTDSNNAVLLDRSVVLSGNGDNRMTGDSIIYEKAIGIVRGYGGVVINNFKDKVDVNGEYA